MKNKDKFKDEIVNIVCNGSVIAVDIRTYGPVDCNTIDCVNCLFRRRGTCSNGLVEWAREEYKKPIVISYNDTLFLNFIKDEYNYIARDKNGFLYAYSDRPEKNIQNCVWKCCASIRIDFFNIDFPMIKWTDDQAWKISDLKKLKVVKNY